MIRIAYCNNNELVDDIPIVNNICDNQLGEHITADNNDSIYI